MIDEATKKYRNEWRDKNRARVNELRRMRNKLNPSKQSLYDKKYRETHPDKIAVKNQNQRARRKNADGFFTYEDVVSIKEKQNNRCYYCGIKIEDSYHIDHKQPLSRSGSNWPKNLAITCPFCNLSKGDKTEEEFKLCLRL